MIGHTLPDAVQGVGRRLGEHLPETWRIMERPPQTMLHGDSQLGNLLFMAEPAGDLSLAVVDWQLTTLGRGPYNLAMLLCMNMDPNDRKAQERSLLQLYHTTLIENGVEDYSFEQCWDDHRLLILNRLFRMVFLIAGGNISHGPYRTILRTYLPFCVAAILDLDAGELLPD